MSYYLTSLCDKKLVSRKTHRCFICGLSIPPRTLYRKSSFVMDGSAYTIKEHVECSSVAAAWCDSFDYPEGYQGEDVYEAMREGLHDPILSRLRDTNVYAIGDLTRQELIVWKRMRRAQTQWELRRAVERMR